MRSEAPLGQILKCSVPFRCFDGDLLLEFLTLYQTLCNSSLNRPMRCLQGILESAIKYANESRTTLPNRKDE